MEYWEFLIQREGDRGWRTIETGNLQLMEGKYRIVANSDLILTKFKLASPIKLQIRFRNVALNRATKLPIGADC